MGLLKSPTNKFNTEIQTKNNNSKDEEHSLNIKNMYEYSVLSKHLANELKKNKNSGSWFSKVLSSRKTIPISETKDVLSRKISAEDSSVSDVSSLYASMENGNLLFSDETSSYPASKSDSSISSSVYSSSLSSRESQNSEEGRSEIYHCCESAKLLMEQPEIDRMIEKVESENSNSVFVDGLISFQMQASRMKVSRLENTTLNVAPLDRHS